MILNPARMFKPTALRYAEEPAIVNFERNRRFSYRQVRNITNQACNMLAQRFGLGEGDKIATLVKNDNMSLLYMMSLKSNTSSLWLGIMESVEEHLYQIDHVRPKLIFIEKGLLDEYYAPLSIRSIVMVAMDEPDEPLNGVYDFWALVDGYSPDEPDMQFVADEVHAHPCAFRFTGGTTGRAKCAMYSLSNLLSSGTNLSYIEVFPCDRPKVLLSTPITHAAGAMIIPTYFRGGTLITLNSADIESFCEAIAREKVELIYTVPTVLYRMVDMRLTEKYDLSSLKAIRYGAAPISPAKLEKLIKQFGSVFIQGYAAAEAWVPGTILSRDDHDSKAGIGLKRLNSVGKPVPGMEFKIVDEEGHEKVAGETGEIWIRGPHTIQGYYNDPEQTRENFTEDGFWKSGDIGFMDADGYLYLIDRRKDMIVSGGMNIYSTEVENCINAHPAVEQSVVVGIPDETWGESVHAEVILKKGERLSGQELIEHCKNNLSRYKAPKSVAFVERLPLSSVGKLLRREVRKKYWKQERLIQDRVTANGGTPGPIEN